MTVSTLSLSLCSPLVTDPAGSSPSGKVRRCNVHVVVLGDGSYPLPARPDQRALPFSPNHRWRRRASDPFFLVAVVWADPASRRPPIHIPTTFTYIFVRNRLSSTCPARYVTACASFSTSQPPRSDGPTSHIFFLLLLEVKLLHGVESCTPSVRKYLSLK